MLANVLYPSEPFHIFRLITQTGQDTTPHAFAERNDVAAVLLEGG
jgi:hypothetical protein